MDLVGFITNKLEGFSKDFFGSKFSYVYDEKYAQHVIEVIPSSIYNLEEFASKQILFELDLIKLFPNIEILFITEGHDLTLPNFDFTISNLKELNTLNYNESNILTVSDFVELNFCQFRTFVVFYFIAFFNIKC